MIPPLLLAMSLAACDHALEGDALPASIFQPIAHRLDMDGDGRVNDREYERVNYAGPPFSEVDLDGDGSLDPAEIAPLVLSQDPLGFDGAPMVVAASPNNDDGMRIAGEISPNPQLIALFNLLIFLAEEVRYRDPLQPVPTDDALLKASASGRLAAAECQAVLQELAAAYQATGMEFPPGLLSHPSSGEGVAP